MVEKITTTIALLILAYLVFNAQNFNDVVTGLGGTGSGLIGTLQGRRVQFGNVQVG